MSTWAVLATGESMSQEMADFVCGKCKVVAVSDAYRLAPWADALVSNDSNWWRNHPLALEFTGRKFCGAQFKDTERLPPHGRFPAGTNSGIQGMRVAEMLGATRILLLGLDMRGTHFFGKHPSSLKNTTSKRFKVHIAQFERWSGCEVINCTPNSALRKFPMSTIEKELGAVLKVAAIPSRAEGAMHISPKHQRLYQDYYAARSITKQPSRWLRRVEAMAKQVGAKTILDYGCGAGCGISAFSGYPVTDYDPGVPECAADPRNADLVVSIHALEHVEPEHLDGVISHMTELADKALFIVVSCEPSTKVLPDGSPWHSFVRDAAWWRHKLSAFDPQPAMMDRPGAEYAAFLLKDQAEMRMIA